MPSSTIPSSTIPSSTMPKSTMPNSTMANAMPITTAVTNPDTQKLELGDSATPNTTTQCSAAPKASRRRTKTQNKITQKMTCAHSGCDKKILPVNEILGKCRCTKTFCALHRMPESHQCDYIFTLNKDEFIESNKCVAEKI